MASSSVPRGMSMIINVVKKQFPKVKNIDTETLNQWLKNTIASISSKMAATAEGDSKSEQQPPQSPNLALLDVRPEKEYQISFIPSARRVDPEEQDMKKLLQLINEVAPSSEPDKRVQVIMYCSVGYRASILATRLEEFLEKEGGDAGLDIYNLEGSIFKWANEDRTMIDKTGQETQYVHPYSRVWCYLVDSQRRKYKL